MNLTATLINLYMVCPRECWLHANGINMEHTSELVYDGKLLHETSYGRRAKKNSEIELVAAWKGVRLRGKIDFYDPTNNTIHETKRGKTVENAHTWQLKFYIWLFELNKIAGVSGKIEYPKLRKTTKVVLTREDRAYLKQTIPKIAQLTNQNTCPPVIDAQICKKCSYYELCYIDEL